MDIKSTPSRQTSSSKKQPINEGNNYDNNYDGEENTIATSTSIDITTMPSTKGTPFKIARWRDLTTDQKWEYQFKHLIEYKEISGNLSMPRNYTIKYNDGKVVNIGKWLDNLKSAERSKHLDNKWLEQLKNIGVFSSKTDVRHGAGGPSTSNS